MIARRLAPLALVALLAASCGDDDKKSDPGDDRGRHDHSHDDDQHGLDRPERHDADPGPAFDQGQPAAPREA